MYAYLDRRHQHQYTDVHTRFDSVPSALPTISHAPAVVPYQEQRAPRDGHIRFYKNGKGPAALSSWPSGLPDRKRSIPNGRYTCNICRLGYAQPQGLSRHYRETHKASLCMYCHNFKWGRPYRFKEHLKKRHPDVDPNVALEKATKARRRVTINTEDLSQPPSTAKHARWSCV